jgi:catechol 2,3-dioxygenase-like lactoylglutathione lyase family enzyme
MTARRCIGALIVTIAASLPLVAASAQTDQVLGRQPMPSVRVRYMVNELDPAVKFYVGYLGFHLEREAKPNFAMLSRGALQLVLSTPFGPGGAAKPMADGRKAEPGGWNRIILEVNDLPAEVARLRKDHVRFRNDIAKGPGGAEILIDDPSGNPVELFEPGSS